MLRLHSIDRDALYVATSELQFALGIVALGGQDNKRILDREIELWHGSGARQVNDAK
jgi:hypothetical protein